MQTKKYEYKKFDNIYAIRLIKDSEIIHSLKEFCEENKITAGIIQGIGALNSLTLGYFNSATKEYKEKTIQGSIEMTSLMGNISIKDSQKVAGSADPYLYHGIGYCWMGFFLLLRSVLCRRFCPLI